ncbi:YceD family protein [Gemelliphila palaticanis]|uniref:Uncharacterized protein n=1 Tax=Gemelliphila palaticanis TaxID=81950 RepID=A0ABX2T0B1_9BACL|nr:YceD family protein [Gemella palaticanis]MBF0716135.1 hypothetical protein [Gemella palaticanis]NYS48065.1 hypothetical protein [Gemella palaticanis]
MKWLRSSLFKNNKDKFFFEEQLDISFKNFDSSLKEVENIVIKGTLTRNSHDKIYVDLNVSGIYKIISSRSLNIIDVPFEIEEQEEFVDSSYYDSDSFSDVSTMDMYIDISDLIKELIILNVPTSYYLEEEKIETTDGKGWSLISEDNLLEESKKDNPFLVLNNMFKEK